jgi:hypothetical protein
MAKSRNQAEFEALGIDDVRKRVSSSIWSEEKLREARDWISNEDSRFVRSAKNAAWTAAIAAWIAAIAAIISALAAIVAVLHLR